MLTVGSRLIGTAIDVDFLGQGVIKHEEYVIFVKSMLKDEVAEIEITSLKKRFAEAKIISLIQQSPMRKNVDNVLESCDLIHMDDDEQLSWQRRMTQETMRKISGLDLDVEEALTDRNYTHYRNKSVFHVMDKPILSLGLFGLNNHRLIKINDFILSDSLTNKILGKLQEARLSVEPNILRHVAIRTNEKNQALVTLVAYKKTFQGLQKILTLLKSIPEVIGVTCNIKKDERHILSDESHLMYGMSTIDIAIGPWEYTVSDQSFFQVNIPVIQMAYEWIKQEIKPNSHVIDAYSGVGSIGYYLIDKVKTMTFIEANHDAVVMTEYIKEKYHVQHVNILEGKAETLIQEIEGDVLVVDPPRFGLTAKFIEIVLEKAFDQVFYLSCDVKTLSRDLDLLSQRYHIHKVVPLRMFPQTTSLETLVGLTLKK